MGRMNGVEDTLTHRLETWSNNPPQYEHMLETYKSLGRCKAAIVRKKREIETVEEAITVEIDKPRSNDAKKAKLNATSKLKDELTELLAELEILEAEIKTLEFLKTMFNAANYRMKMVDNFA